MGRALAGEVFVYLEVRICGWPSLLRSSILQVVAYTVLFYLKFSCTFDKKGCLTGVFAFT